MQKRLISFVLWGRKNTHNRGVLENIRLAPHIYPGWVPVVYCDVTSPAYEQLRQEACELVPVTFRANSWDNIFVRLYAAARPDMEYCIFRDCDSRLNVKERWAVDEWIKSGKALHVMHDDKQHDHTPILTGMFGVAGGWLPKIKEMIDAWMSCQKPALVRKKTSEIDERFMREVVWPMFRNGNYIGHGTPYQGSNGNDYPFPPHFTCQVGNTIAYPESTPSVPLWYRKKARFLRRASAVMPS